MAANNDEEAQWHARIESLPEAARVPMLVELFYCAKSWARLPVLSRHLASLEAFRHFWRTLSDLNIPATQEEVLAFLPLLRDDDDLFVGYATALAGNLPVWPSAEAVDYLLRLCAISTKEETRLGLLAHLVSTSTADVGTSIANCSDLLVTLVTPFVDKRAALVAALSNWPYALSNAVLRHLCPDAVKIAQRHIIRGTMLVRRQAIASLHRLQLRPDVPATHTPCVACQDHQVAVVFSVCGHACLCRACHRKLEDARCPICRKSTGGDAIEVLFP